MTHVIDRDELPHVGTVHEFEGYRYGDANVSFFLTDGPPGTGPALHKHPYAEVFVVQEGDVTLDRKSTRLNSSHANISYAVFCLKKKTIRRCRCPLSRSVLIIRRW